MTTKPALSTEEVTKRYGGVYAVNRVSLSFEAGKLTSIIGPNGSGKTTFMHLLTGLASLDHGTVHIGDNKVNTINPVNLPSYGVTRTFQEVRLFEQMTVLDNVLVVLTPRQPIAALLHSVTSQTEQRANEILKRVNLWDKRGQLAGSLSYGQRKLLEVARVMVMDAKIILFDEPFAGLFKEMVAFLADTMKELRSEGRTLVLIEHNMDLIRSLSDWVYVFDEGKVLAAGPPEAVLVDPKVIEAYLGE